jgi:hypothetical protein
MSKTNYNAEIQKLYLEMFLSDAETFDFGSAKLTLSPACNLNCCHEILTTANIIVHN